ncbi:hypothetical protein QBC32DRAFT_97007 [Pseudoneurospora amorphoporcata]|uniref:Uncharacterized protein n=1 Tax=Pseudoneurospora amorphoporcata TaxID=241081 RepID=A0AAN6P002_9PEZI|nr:hypothetical protein QBC32DRAFT_97007 [Pseudoneurospora amorphoporcata]
MHGTALPQRLGRNAHAALLHRRQLPSTVLRASFSTSIRTASGTPDVIVPRVAKASFWKSLVPKFMRSGHDSIHHTKMPKSNEWNPATFFIIIFLMIGSMAIQMISLKKDFAAFSRQTDVRINTLREVVERIQKGEDVDVEKVLGTGDPEREAAWDEVLREIEREEIMHKAKQQKAPKPAQQAKPEPAKEQPQTQTETGTETKPKIAPAALKGAFF